jgi:hypothetical protein
MSTAYYIQEQLVVCKNSFVSTPYTAGLMVGEGEKKGRQVVRSCTHVQAPSITNCAKVQLKGQ